LCARLAAESLLPTKRDCHPANKMASWQVYLNLYTQTLPYPPKADQSRQR
jgi:hypothetical protein